jgi:hypothetical protein
MKNKVNPEWCNKIQKLLMEYFYNNSREIDFHLPILDKPKGELNKAYDGSGDFYEIDYYTGVTLPYLMKYVIKYKYKKDLVIYSLFDLLDNEKIGSLFCPTINKVVFENNNTNHWTYKVVKETKRKTYDCISSAALKEFNTYLRIKKTL